MTSNPNDEPWFDQPEMQAAALAGFARNTIAQAYADGRWCNRLTGHDGEHDFGRTEVIDTTRMCGLVDTPAPANPPTRPGRVTGENPTATAFYVRDLMAAAEYRYSPDGPLHGQVRECCDLIANTREHWKQLVGREAVTVSRHAAEVQRLTDLVTELRRQLNAALKIAQEHGAKVEPWDFAEPIAANSDAQTWANYRKDGG